MMSHLDKNDLLMMVERSGVIQAISPLGDFIEVNRESFAGDDEFADWPTEMRQILNCPGATWSYAPSPGLVWKFVLLDTQGVRLLPHDGSQAPEYLVVDEGGTPRRYADKPEDVLEGSHVCIAMRGHILIPGDE
jgi:hypothetical protein